MPSLPARLDVESPSAEADKAHRFSYAVTRTVAGDPVFQLYKGPTSDPANLVFEIDLTGRLSKGQLFEVHEDVASQAAMLLLDAQQGDFALRTDNSRVYILAGDDPTDINDWEQLPIYTPAYADLTDSSLVLDAVQALSALGAGGTALRMNEAGTALEFGGVIGCVAYETANQTIPDSEWTGVTHSAELWDTNGLHDTSSNSQRFTADRAGKWRMVCDNYRFADVNTVAVHLRARKNVPDGGTPPVIAQHYISAVPIAMAPVLHFNRVFELDEGDTVDLEVFQGTGGVLNLAIGTTDNPRVTSFIYEGP